MFHSPSPVLRLVAVGLLSAGLFGQAPSASPSPEPVFVTHKDFHSKLFVAKHRDPRDLTRSLYSLGSGAKGAEIVPNRDLGTISVRDFPENIAAIEEALKRLDVPEPARREVEFHVQVLFASNAAGPEGPYPEELRDVLTALKATLAYKRYDHAASLLQRGQEGSRGIAGSGVTEIQIAETKGGKHPVALPFRFEIADFKVETPATGPSIIKLQGMDFRFHSVAPEWETRIRTDLSLKDGEKVVVGTSTLKDRGVVVVLTAHLLK